MLAAVDLPRLNPKRMVSVVSTVLMTIVNRDLLACRRQLETCADDYAIAVGTKWSAQVGRLAEALEMRWHHSWHWHLRDNQ